MNRTRLIGVTTLVVALGASGLALAAPLSHSAATTVDVHTSKLGKILVTSTGRTLYAYKKDTSSKSNCTGTCASVWPPLTGTPHAGPGVSASKLGTISRGGGVRQVTYAGHPLYTFVSDSGSSTKGQGVNNFYVVKP